MLHLSAQEEARYTQLQYMALDFARHGEVEPLEGMISYGLPINLSDNKGNTLLMLAAYNGEEECVKMLLKHGADVNRRNDHGQTPLGGVAFKGYLNICKLLVKAGADTDATSGLGATPLVFATMFGRKESAEYLAQVCNNKKSFLLSFAQKIGVVLQAVQMLVKTKK